MTVWLKGKGENSPPQKLDAVPIEVDATLQELNNTLDNDHEDPNVVYGRLVLRWGKTLEIEHLLHSPARAKIDLYFHKRDFPAIPCCLVKIKITPEMRRALGIW